jgi:hypothetical protein
LALLAEAVTAYRAALTIRTEVSRPSEWAITQNNLGNALKAQGERIADKTGLVLLSDAVTAFRAALTVHTETSMPVNWAATQNNLGNALKVQGARTGGQAGLDLLASALSAYDAALTIRTEAAMPAKWAMTRENVALAYEVMADLGGAPQNNLNAAAEAFLDVLRIYTPDHMPHYHDKATRSLARIREKLAALDS